VEARKGRGERRNIARKGLRPVDGQVVKCNFVESVELGHQSCSQRIEGMMLYITNLFKINARSVARHSFSHGFLQRGRPPTKLVRYDEFGMQIEA
jgi:hypothetical protein